MFQYFLDENPAFDNGAFSVGTKCSLEKEVGVKEETLARWN